MMSEDPLDLAQTAIARIAVIASRLAVQYKRPVCGRLSAELLLVAIHLDTAGLDQEEQLRVRISKLLRDVEMICSLQRPRSRSRNIYPLLESIAHAEPDSPRYSKAEAEIWEALDKKTSKTGLAAENAILHIQKFRKRGDRERRKTSKETPLKRSTPTEDSSSVNPMAYNLLREHTRCTCNNETVQVASGGHLVRLLLQPPPSTTDHSQVQYDMLFSSAPFWNGSRFNRWRDVQLLVPRVQKKSKKRVRFPDYNGGTLRSLPAKQLMEVKRGDFCKLMSSEAESRRICLTIQDGKLQKSGFEPLRRLVKHVPSISLASILDQYHLTAKMKVTLAYILAQSVWQYYDSDWMKTSWTSKTIQFMEECESDGAGEHGKLFAWKPYLSVSFGGEDPDSDEFSNVEGEIHRYPRIRALGILLVEILIGSPLRSSDKKSRPQPLAAKTNGDLLLAIQYSKNEKLWGDFDYPNFLSAANYCLDPGTFTLAPGVRGVDDKEEVEGLKQRRYMLYERVVFPLEELLHGTGWMKQLTTIGPLEIPVKHSAAQLVAKQYSTNDAAVRPPPKEEPAKKPLSESQKGAKKWLSRMRQLNTELSQTRSQIVGSSATRIRIAVLDTGCDNNAPFFHHPDNGPRLREWKDWVDGSDQWQDCDGHGTHLVSLVMKTAPVADLYVARIAESPRTLLESSEIAAEAISWASKEWKADIISMSFGFAEEQQCISGAIRRALYERNDAILFFAAASNFGANDREMFPARHDSVISIRGTNSNGQFEDFNPPRTQNEETALGTLGLDVPSAGLSDHDDEVYKSGTSIATAIAAAIAGVLLEYVNGISRGGAIQEVNKKLRRRRGMQAMFKALALQRGDERYLYFAPWKLMGRSDEERCATFVAALHDVF